MTVTVGSLADPAKSASATLTTTAIPATPLIGISQPGGPATGVVITNDGRLPGHEYYNLFTVELCGAVGSGPYLGLCASDPSFLLSQVAQPVGALPFHLVATTVTASFGPLLVPAGLAVDAIIVDVTGGLLGPVSPVARFTAQ